MFPVYSFYFSTCIGSGSLCGIMVLSLTSSNIRPVIASLPCNQPVELSLVVCSKRRHNQSFPSFHIFQEGNQSFFHQSCPEKYILVDDMQYVSAQEGRLVADPREIRLKIQTAAPLCVGFVQVFCPIHCPPDWLKYEEDIEHICRYNNATRIKFEWRSMRRKSTYSWLLYMVTRHTNTYEITSDLDTRLQHLATHVSYKQYFGSNVSHTICVRSPSHLAPKHCPPTSAMMEHAS